VGFLSIILWKLGDGHRAEKLWANDKEREIFIFTSLTQVDLGHRG